MDSKIEDIPWKQVVQFHREIVQLKHDSFFSLPYNDELNVSRWTSINQNFFHNMQGPWEVNYESIVNPIFLDKLQNEEIIEAYIGGPCWIESFSSNQTTSTSVNPFFYRAVQLEVCEDHIRILPSEGIWEISPKVHQYFSRKETETENSLEDIGNKIINNIPGKFESNDSDLENHLISSFVEIVPEIDALFKDKTLRKKLNLISSWVLFVPPLSSSPYNKHILRDYEELEKKITADPSVLGGLKVFDPIIPGTDVKESEILPIIPLNESQKFAISEILESKPITVISGPPGCGKSQVVTSLLLNAWANDISLLFSSTTNAAVNVVFERLSHFESDYPVAIRAGSRSKNNIDESFQKVLNRFYLSSSNQEKETEKMQQTRDLLIQKKERLQSFLDNRIPQQITESLRSSLVAYSNYSKIEHQIEKENYDFFENIQLLGYEEEPKDFESNIVTPLKIWLKDVDRVNKQIKLNQQEQKELLSKLEDSQNKRNLYLKKLHINEDEGQNFNWLIKTDKRDHFASWYQNLSSLLNSYSENLFPSREIKEEYLSWGGKRDLEFWMRNSSKLKDKIEFLLQHNSEAMKSMSIKKIEFERMQDELNDRGLYDTETYDLDKLDKWNKQYLQLSLIPSGFKYILKRRKCKKDIENIESEISRYFPIDLLRLLSTDEDIGRENIHKNIQAIFKWVKIENEWNQQKLDSGDLDQKLQNCYSTARKLDLINSSYNTDVEFWIDIIKEIRSKINLAMQALEAWNKKDEADQFFENLNRNALEFQTLVNTNPIVNTWFQKEDSDFRDSIFFLCLEATPDIISGIQLNFRKIQFDDFVSTWKDAVEAEIEIQKYLEFVGKIETEQDLIESWWNNKPTCSINKLDFTKLPEKEDLLYEHLEECIQVNEKWSNYEKSTLSTSLKEKDQEYNWAKNQLNEAVSKIPIDNKKSHVENVIRPLFEESNSPWPIDELNDIFAEFDPEKIKAQIDNINSQLEDLSYSLAKRWWMNRIKSKSGTLESVKELYDIYRKNNYRINNISVDTFKKALNAFPVWITTALSTQSIPMEADLFDILVIDEASQCTLTNILPLVYRAKRIVIIGDQNQLPAISEISDGKEQALATKHNVSEWLHLISHTKNNVYNAGVEISGRASVISLVEHYRSHPLIIGFSNQHIYHRQLKLMKGLNEYDNPIHAGIFGLDIKGVCRKGYKGKSWVNKPEIDSICGLLDDFQKAEEFDNLSIGIVSPFKEQARILEEKIDCNATTGTAHAFQGDEKDIIIFSPVISRGIKNGAINFANNEKLVNVALTRAKKGLFVVGDFDYCKKSGGIISKLIEYVETVSLLRNTSREELDLFSWMIIEGLTPEVHANIGNIEVDFLLKKDGTKLIVEVDGKQHYLVNVDGVKHNVSYENGFYCIKIDDEKHFIKGSTNNEYVEINDEIYPVTRTEESVEIDKIRDQSLKSHGYKVLRIPTKAVRETPTNVISNIKQELGINTNFDFL